MSGGVPAGELLPCPFCGGAAISALVDRKGVKTFARVLCLDCPAKVDVETREKAITAWNARATPTPQIEGRDADVERECQAVWRCAIGDAVGALDVLRTQWEKSRRKQEREAGAKLAIVLDLVWAARDPAAASYKEAHANGNALIARARAAPQALGERP